MTHSKSEIESLVKEWFRSYSEKDFEAHNALIHPDCVVVYPEMCFLDANMSAGRDFLVKTLEKDEANFLDLRQTVTNTWIVGSTAIVEGFFSGGKLGGSIAETAKGSDINLRFLHHMEWEDGMVKLMHSYYDTALLYQIQLGLEGPTKENPVAPWMLAMASGQKP